jgi:hypothetical protein
MCFTSAAPMAAPKPAAAPAPAAPPAEQPQLAAKRRRENMSAFGRAAGPMTRRDASADTGTVGTTGVKV